MAIKLNRVQQAIITAIFSGRSDKELQSIDPSKVETLLNSEAVQSAAVDLEPIEQSFAERHQQTIEHNSTAMPEVDAVQSALVKFAKDFDRLASGARKIQEQAAHHDRKVEKASKTTPTPDDLPEVGLVAGGMSSSGAGG